MRIVARKKRIRSRAVDIAGGQNLIGIRISAGDIVVEHVVLDECRQRSHNTVPRDRRQRSNLIDIECVVCATIPGRLCRSNRVIQIPMRHEICVSRDSGRLNRAAIGNRKNLIVPGDIIQKAVEESREITWVTPYVHESVDSIRDCGPCQIVGC